MSNEKFVESPPCRDHPKRLGERAEAMFLHRALSRGLAIAKPWGDSERYDFILDTGEKLWRVQVKSSSYQPDVRRGYHFKAYTRSCKACKAYTPNQIEIIAAYVVPEDIWYIIPLAALASFLTFTIHTDAQAHAQTAGRRRAVDFEPYREAWWILGGEKFAGAKAVG